MTSKITQTPNQSVDEKRGLGPGVLVSVCYTVNGKPIIKPGTKFLTYPLESLNNFLTKSREWAKGDPLDEGEQVLYLRRVENKAIWVVLRPKTNQRCLIINRLFWRSCKIVSLPEDQ